MISDTLTIAPLHVPESLDAADAADFHAMVRIGNARPAARGCRIR